MVEINLLPWRTHLFLAQQNKWRQIWWSLIVSSLFLLGGEVLFFTYFQQKLNAVTLERQEVQASVPTADDSQAQLAAQMAKKLNYFLSVCQKIRAGEQYHIQLIKMNYADKKIVMTGNANSIADLSDWVKALNAQGLHVFVQQLSKSVRSDQFHFLVLI